jgi:hypothetical protein
MSEPATKTELINKMISARRQLDSLLDQIDPTMMTIPGAAGEWSVKDIIAHINAYDRWLALTMALKGQKPPDLWMEDLPLDKFNQLLYEQIRDLPLEQVLLESRQLWRQILEATQALPEDYLFAERSIQGDPDLFRPCDILRSESYGHYLDHLADLRAWIEAGI